MMISSTEEGQSSRPNEAKPSWATPRRQARPTYGPRVARIAEVLGKPLMPWQADLADVALEVDPKTGLLAYRTVIVTVPRQSGKSTLLMAKNVQRMADAAQFGGRQRLIYTAASREAARDKLLNDWVQDLTAARRMNGRWRASRRTGVEAVHWENGSIWGIQSNKEESGHGSTLDVADIDEAWSHVTDKTEQAVRPAMITRQQAQLWVISTAGTDKSNYLREKVRLGREAVETGLSSGICYVEYSADPDADPLDPMTWWSCMPALGSTITEDVIRGELLGMSLAGFCRSYLNLWVPSNYGSEVIPSDDWDACEDAKSQIDLSKGIVLAVDVAPGSAWGSIAVSGYRDDELPHGEVIEHREGDGWVVARVSELLATYGRHTPVFLDPKGTAGALLPEFFRAGIDVTTIDGAAMAQGCAALKSKTGDQTWRHRGQDLLRDALKGASTRQLLDAWAWKRNSSSCDISPLVALTVALWGLSVTPARRELTEEELLNSFG